MIKVEGIDGAYRKDDGTIIFERKNRKLISDDKYIQMLEKRLRRLEARVKRLEEGE